MCLRLPVLFSAAFRRGIVLSRSGNREHRKCREGLVCLEEEQPGGLGLPARAISSRRAAFTIKLDINAMWSVTPAVVSEPASSELHKSSSRVATSGIESSAPTEGHVIDACKPGSWERFQNKSYPTLSPRRSQARR
jgi:hypothetical protein